MKLSPRFEKIYRKLPRAAWLLIGTLVLFMLLSGFTNLNVFLGRVWLEHQPLKPADALIILGGGINEETGVLSFKTEERVRTGAQLFLEKKIAPVVVVTGGKVGSNPFAEAPAMAKLLQQLGVVENNIIQEDKAQNTLENAANVVAIGRKLGWKSIIVLTSDFHTSRACTFFRNAGAPPVTCRAADRSTVSQSSPIRRLQSMKGVLREYAANLFYWLTGKL
ncbi:MAG: YdcF family protein [bacterium]|nr:YdcF family protein [bacterium]